MQEKPVSFRTLGPFINEALNLQKLAHAVKFVITSP
jgi:hypothetical protein